MLEIFKNYFIIVPIIFLIITIILIIKLNKRNKNYVQTEGLIADFYENTSEMKLNNYEHKAISPIINYEVNGENFEFIGNYCSTTMKKGDKIQIMYNSDNPKQVIIKKGLNFAILILSIFTIASFITYIILQLAL